jgi:outer membrane receptor protein involved in Fe transport
MTAMTRRFRWTLFITSMLASGALQARAGAQADELELLAQENRVYAAARYVQTLAETPANVTIIGREDIRRYGYRSVQDALKSVPGVYDAASQWPALGMSGVAVPGDFNSRILYLVNGMPVYEPTYGGFFFDYLDIESIERIEVVKGPGSALYGSGAVIGLVNLITRSTQDAPAATAALTLGSHRSAKGYLAHSRHDAGGSHFVSASVERSAGRAPYFPEMDKPEFNQARFHGVSDGFDSARTLRLFGRLTRGNAWAQALLVSSSKDDPLASYGSTFNARLPLREATAAFEAGTVRDMDNGARLTARAYLFGTSERGDYPYAFSGERGVPADYINVSDLRSSQLGAELRYDLYMASGHHILAGVEAKRISYTHEVGDQPGLTRDGWLTVDTTGSYRQWALFAQDELKAGDGKLFLGARYDSYQGFSEGVRSRISPRVAYVRELASKMTVKLIYGEAYRAPTIYESRYQDGLPNASTIWENKYLEPEISRSFEALLLSQPDTPFQWRLSAFARRLRNSPVQVVTPVYLGLPCALGPAGCIQYRNSGQTQRVLGVEADASWHMGDHNDAYASFVLQRGRDQQGDLTSSPRRVFKAGLARRLPWPDSSAAIDVQYVGSVQGMATDNGAPRDQVPAVVLVGLAANVDKLPGGWRLGLRIDNLFDRDNATVASRELQPLLRVPSNGRHASLQLLREF